MTKINAYAAFEKGGELKPYEYDAPELGRDDIEISITHCGICHSDLSVWRDEWGILSLPFVPGHEIVGTVTRAGSDVKTLTEGQRVGVGWQCNSCGQCEWCRGGEEQFCAQNQPTMVGRPGGYADRIVVDARFALPIPASLASGSTAPFLCGGITVYSPLRNANLRPGMKVGIVGIGGLGHMALQFARTFGVEVTAFSTSPGKEAEAKRLGAHHFAATRDPEVLKSLAGTFDLIISTVSADLDWNGYISALRPRGKLSVVGMPDHEIHFGAFPLIGGEKSVSGSVIGSPLLIEEMLQVAAFHNLEAQSENFAMSDVNQALAHVAENKARYRAVLVN